MPVGRARPRRPRRLLRAGRPRSERRAPSARTAPTRVRVSRRPDLKHPPSRATCSRSGRPRWLVGAEGRVARSTQAFNWIHMPQSCSSSNSNPLITFHTRIRSRPSLFLCNNHPLNTSLSSSSSLHSSATLLILLLTCSTYRQTSSTHIRSTPSNLRTIPVRPTRPLGCRTPAWSPGCASFLRRSATTHPGTSSLNPSSSRRTLLQTLHHTTRTRRVSARATSRTSLPRTAPSTTASRHQRQEEASTRRIPPSAAQVLPAWAGRRRSTTRSIPLPPTHLLLSHLHLLYPHRPHCSLREPRVRPSGAAKSSALLCSCPFAPFSPSLYIPLHSAFFLSFLLIAAVCVSIFFSTPVPPSAHSGTVGWRAARMEK